MLLVDRNAPPADPIWGDVMRELVLGGMDHLNGSSGMRTADGSWLIYVPDAHRVQWLELRGVKQITRTLAPMTGAPTSALKVTFTADRAALPGSNRGTLAPGAAPHWRTNEVCRNGETGAQISAGPIDVRNQNC